MRDGIDDTPEAILASFVTAADVRSGLLITKEGSVLARAGDLSYLDPTAMAALVAGMFSATREVARMVGEHQFSILLQQGENRHIHISLTTGTTMLVAIFEDYQRIGRVRYEARKIEQRLAEVIKASADPQRVRGELSMVDFKEGAFHRIDRIFSED